MTATLIKTDSVAPEVITPRPELTKRELDVIDRCDHCGARAYVRAWKEPYINELQFCGHDYREYKTQLELQGFGIDDQTVKLYEGNTKPMSGSNMAD